MTWYLRSQQSIGRGGTHPRPTIEMRRRGGWIGRPWLWFKSRRGTTVYRGFV